MTTPARKATIELGPEIPSREIACALKCVDDPNCMAYDFDQTTKCILMTQIFDGISDAVLTAFGRVKGKNIVVFVLEIARLFNDYNT